MSLTTEPSAEDRTLDRVVIRFAGDSGDGMQLTGDRFTSASALIGNDLVTLPEYPAEIRAPAGTVAGVSAFQVHISDHPITTPGDEPDVLVAMNPAALRSELPKLSPGATVILNIDAFDERNYAKAGYDHDPLEGDDLKGFTRIDVPMTTMTRDVCAPLGVKPRDAERSKNFFALGVVSWMFSRPVEPTLEWIEAKFGNKPTVRDANVAAFNAGHAFAETIELFGQPYRIAPVEEQVPGEYTSINGNTATAWGLIVASHQAKLPLFLGSYPITPASDILHELSKHKNFGVRTFQAEDEIAGIGAALGAAYAGQLAVTTTSGPGVALKAETIGLAISLELPLVVIDVQRGGPSTGLPTKTEQADLLLAMYGHHGESPLPIVAASTPAGCFWATIEACRIALKYRTPVFLLTDGYLANGAEPWLIPDPSTFPDISVPFLTELNHELADGTKVLWQYQRDPETLARPWIIPGTPGLEHRIGGIEKEDGTGNISYVPSNHEKMVHLRAEKVAGIAKDIPPAVVEGDEDHEILLVGWGSTWGAINGGMERVQRSGRRVGHVHLTHLNPFPANLGELLARAPKVLVPEMNLGQLSRLLRAEYLVDARSATKVQGLPFTAREIEAAILGVLDD